MSFKPGDLIEFRFEDTFWGDIHGYAIALSGPYLVPGQVSARIDVYDILQGKIRQWINMNVRRVTLGPDGNLTKNR